MICYLEWGPKMKAIVRQASLGIPFAAISLTISHYPISYQEILWSLPEWIPYYQNWCYKTDQSSRSEKDDGKLR